MSMLYGDNAIEYDTLIDDYQFVSLFEKSKTLQTISNNFLPATKLSKHCYRYMFYNCTSLKNAPKLPAKDLSEYTACYFGMFSYCEKLTTAPELPATKLSFSCYDNMFQSCYALTTAPELPATSLAGNCYVQMFQNCKKLTKAPSILPATTLTDRCYQQMFEYCYELTTGPTLPAATLTPYCYHLMFAYNTKFNYIKMLAKDVSAEHCLTRWLDEVASNGTFVKHTNATWNIVGVDGIPSTWTINYASS